MHTKRAFRGFLAQAMLSSLALLFLGLAISTAQAQVSQEWVARYASPTPYSDVPYAMTLDAAGNVYVTGTFTGTINFGTGNLVSASATTATRDARNIRERCGVGEGSVMRSTSRWPRRHA